MPLCFCYRRCNHAALGGLLYQLFNTTHEIIPRSGWMTVAMQDSMQESSPVVFMALE